MNLITTPFGFGSTAAEVVADVDLTGKRIVVTGASSGIGIETARALAGAGAEVTLGVRNLEAGEKTAAEIRSSTSNPAVWVRRLDLSDQGSLQTFAANWEGPLHILVNNAGIMALPTLERTPEGWEMQFATNFLGHFALAIGLHRALAAANGARIVSVSSSGNLIAPVIFDDLHFDFLPYDPLVAYGQSKSACALLAVEATRRWANDGIVSNALNPGAIATNLQKHTGGLKTPPERRKTPQQGAATSVLLAASPLLEGVGGCYFEDCNEATTVSKRPSDWMGVAHYALDPANAERLWNISLGLIS
ncbi:SDR family NAD(P)-dependent oxidoreductase (plasmid) [Microvirga terrae]|uniref:SDR family NAD(P)-dependent oxidoreductase n=1 Tax=Microvirga terrae TaxID=2740529 RepID=A0ABY5S090_9HYPH|nr:SDR family NAD(P)-dependent oxidoreductase [Microvirga terrae]UVF22634.1 SDR family NAD(P)-dependent oxidoreductase [Microvirga terrae]